MDGIRARSCTVALAALFVAGVATAAGGPATLDHFTLYAATGNIDPPTVVLEDQFGIQTTDLGPTRFFLVPADKNGEGIIDPDSHLTCYQIANGPGGPAKVTATHQFGTDSLDLGAARVACIPSEKFPPAQISIDHYVCYDAVGDPLGASATFVDQFYGFTHQITTPFLFCAPARKTVPPNPGPEAPILDPLSHLACYVIEPPGQPVGIVPIRNQFGGDEIDVQQRLAVCLPAQKEVPPPGVLDHFLYYDSVGPDGPLVTVEDQFGPLDPTVGLLDLGPVRSFLVPADKNQEGIVDPFSHLTGYLMPAPPPAPAFRQVIATNQFGDQALELVGARELLVPTMKLLAGAEGPVSIDHFACYDAIGAPLDLPISIRDQFHQAEVATVVREPFMFCNPANKNDEGIVNADDHLACFRVDPTVAAVGQIPISNQFGGAQIDVASDVGLCVPSKKTIVPKVPSLSGWGAGVLGAWLLALPAWLAARRHRGAA